MGVNHFVDVDGLKTGRPAKSQIPYHELEKLFFIMYENAGISLRNIAIFECFYGTGITTLELSRLLTSDVDFDLEQLRCRDNRRDRERFIPLPAGSMLAIKQYMAFRRLRWPTSKFLFPSKAGKHLCKSTIYGAVKSFLVITSSKEKGSRAIRNTYEKHLLKAGATLENVQVLLGHRTALATAMFDDSYRANLRQQYILAHPKA